MVKRMKDVTTGFIHQGDHYAYHISHLCGQKKIDHTDMYKVEGLYPDI